MVPVYLDCPDGAGEIAGAVADEQVGASSAPPDAHSDTAAPATARIQRAAGSKHASDAANTPPSWQGSPEHVSMLAHARAGSATGGAEEAPEQSHSGGTNALDNEHSEKRGASDIQRADTQSATAQVQPSGYGVDCGGTLSVAYLDRPDDGRRACDMHSVAGAGQVTSSVRAARTMVDACTSPAGAQLPEGGVRDSPARTQAQCTDSSAATPEARQLEQLLCDSSPSTAPPSTGAEMREEPSRCSNTSQRSPSPPAVDETQAFDISLRHAEPADASDQRPPEPSGEARGRARHSGSNKSHEAVPLALQQGHQAVLGRRERHEHQQSAAGTQGARAQGHGACMTFPDAV